MIFSCVSAEKDSYGRANWNRYFRVFRKNHDLPAKQIKRLESHINMVLSSLFCFSCIDQTQTSAHIYQLV
jgi:hypothetical protein